MVARFAMDSKNLTGLLRLQKFSTRPAGTGRDLGCICCTLTPVSRARVKV